MVLLFKILTLLLIVTKNIESIENVNNTTGLKEEIDYTTFNKEDEIKQLDSKNVPLQLSIPVDTSKKPNSKSDQHWRNNLKRLLSVDKSTAFNQTETKPLTNKNIIKLLEPDIPLPKAGWQKNLKRLFMTEKEKKESLKNRNKPYKLSPNEMEEKIILAEQKILKNSLKAGPPIIEIHPKKLISLDPETISRLNKSCPGIKLMRQKCFRFLPSIETKNNTKLNKRKQSFCFNSDDLCCNYDQKSEDQRSSCCFKLPIYEVLKKVLMGSCEEDPFSFFKRLICPEKYECVDTNTNDPGQCQYIQTCPDGTVIKVFSENPICISKKDALSNSRIIGRNNDDLSSLEICSDQPVHIDFDGDYIEDKVVSVESSESKSSSKSVTKKKEKSKSKKKRTTKKVKYELEDFDTEIDDCDFGKKEQICCDDDDIDLDEYEKKIKRRKDLKKRKSKKKKSRSEDLDCSDEALECLKRLEKIVCTTDSDCKYQDSSLKKKSKKKYATQDLCSVTPDCNECDTNSDSNKPCFQVVACSQQPNNSSSDSCLNQECIQLVPSPEKPANCCCNSPPQKPKIELITCQKPDYCLDPSVANVIKIISCEEKPSPPPQNPEIVINIKNDSNKPYSESVSKYELTLQNPEEEKQEKQFYLNNKPVELYLDDRPLNLISQEINSTNSNICDCPKTAGKIESIQSGKSESNKRVVTGQSDADNLAVDQTSKKDSKNELTESKPEKSKKEDVEVEDTPVQLDLDNENDQKLETEKKEKNKKEPDWEHISTYYDKSDESATKIESLDIIKKNSDENKKEPDWEKISTYYEQSNETASKTESEITELDITLKKDSDKDKKEPDWEQISAYYDQKIITVSSKKPDKVDVCTCDEKKDLDEAKKEPDWEKISTYYDQKTPSDSSKKPDKVDESSSKTESLDISAKQDSDKIKKEPDWEKISTYYDQKPPSDSSKKADKLDESTSKTESLDITLKKDSDKVKNEPDWEKISTYYDQKTPSDSSTKADKSGESASKTESQDNNKKDDSDKHTKKPDWEKISTYYDQSDEFASKTEPLVVNIELDSDKKIQRILKEPDWDAVCYDYEAPSDSSTKADKLDESISKTESLDINTKKDSDKVQKDPDWEKISTYYDQKPPSDSSTKADKLDESTSKTESPDISAKQDSDKVKTEPDWEKISTYYDQKPSSDSSTKADKLDESSSKIESLDISAKQDSSIDKKEPDWEKISTYYDQKPPSDSSKKADKSGESASKTESQNTNKKVDSDKNKKEPDWEKITYYDQSDEFASKTEPLVVNIELDSDKKIQKILKEPDWDAVCYDYEAPSDSSTKADKLDESTSKTESPDISAKQDSDKVKMEPDWEKISTYYDQKPPSDSSTKADKLDETISKTESLDIIAKRDSDKVKKDPDWEKISTYYDQKPPSDSSIKSDKLDESISKTESLDISAKQDSDKVKKDPDWEKISTYYDQKPPSDSSKKADKLDESISKTESQDANKKDDSDKVKKEPDWEKISTYYDQETPSASSTKADKLDESSSKTESLDITLKKDSDKDKKEPDWEKISTYYDQTGDAATKKDSVDIKDDSDKVKKEPDWEQISTYYDQKTPSDSSTKADKLDEFDKVIKDKSIEADCGYDIYDYILKEHSFDEILKVPETVSKNITEKYKSVKISSKRKPGKTDDLFDFTLDNDTDKISSKRKSIEAVAKEVEDDCADDLFDFPISNRKLPKDDLFDDTSEKEILNNKLRKPQKDSFDIALTKEPDKDDTEYHTFDYTSDKVSSKAKAAKAACESITYALKEKLLKKKKYRLINSNAGNLADKNLTKIAIEVDLDKNKICLQANSEANNATQSNLLQGALDDIKTTATTLHLYSDDLIDVDLNIQVQTSKAKQDKQNNMKMITNEEKNKNDGLPKKKNDDMFHHESRKNKNDNGSLKIVSDNQNKEHEKYIRDIKEIESKENKTDASYKDKLYRKYKEGKQKIFPPKLQCDLAKIKTEEAGAFLGNLQKINPNKRKNFFNIFKHEPEQIEKPTFFQRLFKPKNNKPDEKLPICLSKKLLFCSSILKLITYFAEEFFIGTKKKLKKSPSGQTIPLAKKVDASSKNGSLDDDTESIQNNTPENKLSLDCSSQSSDSSESEQSEYKWRKKNVRFGSHKIKHKQQSGECYEEFADISIQSHSTKSRSVESISIMDSDEDSVSQYSKSYYYDKVDDSDCDSDDICHCDDDISAVISIKHFKSKSHKKNKLKERKKECDINKKRRLFLGKFKYGNTPVYV